MHLLGRHLSQLLVRLLPVEVVRLLRWVKRRSVSLVRRSTASPPRQLLMQKPSLDDLPPLRFPEGCRLRHFSEGDQARWNAIVDLAFGLTPGTSNFDREMRSDPEFRPERVLFVERAGDVIATASAWYRPVFGPRCGYVHWVATHPDHRGQKLGYWASLAALHRMKAEGRAAAMLHTDDFRLAALRTYLQMGFEPVLDDPSHRARWRSVLVTLQWPERFEATLEGPLRRLVRRLK